MKKENLSILIVICALLIQPSKAHHSVFAEYDINGSITIEGVVTEVWFKNPHVKFFVEVTNKNGQKVKYTHFKNGQKQYETNYENEKKNGQERRNNTTQK